MLRKQLKKIKNLQQPLEQKKKQLGSKKIHFVLGIKEESEEQFSIQVCLGRQ